MREYDSAEDAYTVLNTLSREYDGMMVVDVFEDLELDDGVSTQDLERSHKLCLIDLHDIGLLDKRSDSSDPRGSIYSRSDIGDDVGSVIERYVPALDSGEEVFDSFKLRKNSTYMDFLARIESGDAVEDMYGVIGARGTVLQHIQDASDLGLAEEEDGDLAVTEQGETVQEFVREIGDAFGDEEEDEEEAPVWERHSI